MTLNQAVTILYINNLKISCVKLSIITSVGFLFCVICLLSSALITNPSNTNYVFNCKANL